MLITVTLNPAIDRILWAPGFRAGRTVQARVVAVVPAGKGVNVSRYLAALGVPSVAAGFIGARERAFYEECLAPSGVTPAFVEVDAPTRVNTTILGGRGRGLALSQGSGRRSGETHLREEGFSVPPAKRAALRRVLAQWARKGNTFAFCGSLPKGFAAAEFARLIRELRRAGASVAVDTSGGALRAAVGAGVDILSPNEAELRELAVPASRLLKRVGAIAVKRGAKGGRLITREGVCSASAAVPARRVRNTVGAGDAFLAGFLFAREAGLPDAECLRAAVAAGASAVVAGVVGRLSRRDFDRFLRRATLNPPNPGRV